MSSTTAEKTMEKLGEIFSCFGFPEELVSDNGPQFISQDFERFLEPKRNQHIRSAPYHPLRMDFIQSTKHALKVSQEPGSLHQWLNSFLLPYRNVQHSTTKVALAVLLMKKQLRTSFDLVKLLNTSKTVLKMQQDQVMHHSGRDSCGASCFRNYCRGSTDRSAYSSFNYTCSWHQQQKYLLSALMYSLTYPTAMGQNNPLG